MKKLTIDAKVSVNGKKSIVKMDKPVEIYTKTGVDSKIKSAIEAAVPVVPVVPALTEATYDFADFNASPSGELDVTTDISIVNSVFPGNNTLVLPLAVVGEKFIIINKTNYCSVYISSQIGDTVSFKYVGIGETAIYECFRTGEWIKTTNNNTKIITGPTHNISHTNGVQTVVTENQKVFTENYYILGVSVGTDIIPVGSQNNTALWTILNFKTAPSSTTSSQIFGTSFQTSGDLSQYKNALATGALANTSNVYGNGYAQNSIKIGPDIATGEYTVQFTYIVI